jgi:MFS family permease
VATGRIRKLLEAVSNRRIVALLYPVILFTLIWATYHPCLEHMPRADHWAFLLDTIDQHNFGDILARTYSYNRTRQVGPGDTDLFRPILFALLSAEKALFGNNFAAIQAVGILLHFLVTWLLFRLLLRISDLRSPTEEGSPEGRPPKVRFLRLLAYALPIFFALNFSIQELVVWCHLHGYLLFIVFLLISLLLLLSCVEHSAAPRLRNWAPLIGAWTLALLAAFTYELGQFYAVAAGLFLSAAIYTQGRGWRRRISFFLVFAAILPLYQTANYLDRHSHRGRYPAEDVGAQIVERAFSEDTARHAGRFLLYTTFQPFFPSAARWWMEDGRINIQEATLAWEKYWEPRPRLIFSYLVAGLFLVLGVIGLRNLVHARSRVLLLTLALLAGLFGLYAAMTVLGRMNVRPWPNLLRFNSYYAYIALVFFLPAAFLALQGLARSRRPGPMTNVACACLLVGLLLQSLYSGGRIHGVAAKIAERDKGLRDIVTGIGDLVRSQNDPDFRLAFDFADSDPIDGPHGVPAPLILFKRHIDNHQPKHVVTFRQGIVRAVLTAEYRRRHPRTTGQLFPDLIAVGTHYNFYHFGGAYYGTLAWEEHFRPESPRHPHVLVGGSLEEIYQQAGPKLAAVKADIARGHYLHPRSEVRELAAGCRSFDLYQGGDFYYALPQGTGPFEVVRFNARAYPICFVGRTLASLREMVEENAGVELSQDSDPRPAPVSP